MRPQGIGFRVSTWGPAPFRSRSGKNRRSTRCSLGFHLIHYTHMQLSSWNGVMKSNSQIYCCHGRVALTKAYTTRWSTTHSSKVNLPHAITFRTLCRANFVTGHLRIWSGIIKTHAPPRVSRPPDRGPSTCQILQYKFIYIYV